MRTIRRVLLTGLLATFAHAALPAAASAPRDLPTNACIERLIDEGLTYKAARRICSQPPR